VPTGGEKFADDDASLSLVEMERTGVNDFTATSASNSSFAVTDVTGYVEGASYLVEFDYACGGVANTVNFGKTVSAEGMIVGTTGRFSEVMTYLDNAGTNSLLIFDLISADTRISNITIKRVDHGYFGINESTPVEEYLDGFQGFNTTNGNSVIDNVITEGTGDPIRPVTGLLKEPESTNVINTTSNILTAGGAWSPSGASSIASTELIAGKPAFEIKSTVSGTNVVHEIYSTNLLAVADGGFGAASCSFAKKTGDALFGYMIVWDSGGTFYCGATVNLATGEVFELADTGTTILIVPNSAKVTEVAEGWRLSFAVEGSETDPTKYYDVGFSDSEDSPLATYTNGQSLGFINHPQFEEDTVFATSYIETVDGTDVTRDADTLEFDIANLLNAQGTIYIEVNPLLSSSEMDAASEPHWGIVGTIDGQQYGQLYCQSLNSHNIGSWDGTYSNTTSLPAIKNQVNKLAVSWGDGIWQIAVDGVADANDDRYTGAWDTDTNIIIGDGFAGHITNFQIFNKALSQSKLEEMTS